MRKQFFTICICTLAAYAAEHNFNANPNCVKAKSNSAVYFDFNPTQNQLAVARKCGEILILDSENLKTVKKYDVIRDINQVRFFNGGSNLVTGGEWGFEFIDLLKDTQIRKHGTEFAAPSILSNFTSSIFFTEYGGWLKQWQTSLEQSILTKSTLRPIIGAALSNDGKNIALFGHNKIRMYSSQGKVEAEQEHKYSDDTMIEWCSDGESFITTGYDRTVKLWSRKLEHTTLLQMSNDVFAASCSKMLIVAGDCRGTLSIFDRKTKQRLDMKISPTCVDSIQIEAKNNNIYVGTRDYHVYRLDTKGIKKAETKLP